MSKRNISYIKPADPTFLAQLKQQIGYREGPSVETKRQKLEDLESDSYDSGEDRPEREDERPQIVVLKAGDLTAEEAATEEKRLEKEAAEAPANLNEPIVFRKRHKANEELDAVLGASSSPSLKSSKIEKHKKDIIKKSSNTTNTAKLSFNVDEEEEEE